MEELRDSSIHHTALKFCEDVKQMKIYNNLYKTVQVDIITVQEMPLTKNAFAFRN